MVGMFSRIGRIIFGTTEHRTSLHTCVFRCGPTVSVLLRVEKVGASLAEASCCLLKFNSRLTLGFSSHLGRHSTRKRHVDVVQIADKTSRDQYVRDLPETPKRIRTKQNYNSASIERGEASLTPSCPSIEISGLHSDSIGINKKDWNDRYRTINERVIVFCCQSFTSVSEQPIAMPTTAWNASCVAALLLFVALTGNHGVEALSQKNLNKKNELFKKNKAAVPQSSPIGSLPSGSRRQIMALLFGAATSLPLGFAANFNKDNENGLANASCIPGDTSPDCIGTFREKIPFQTHRGVNTNKDIHINNYSLRPDRDNVVLATPDTIDEAIGMLTDQRFAMDEVAGLVSSGQMESAGMRLLAALPKITVAGRFVVWAVKTGPAAPQLGDMLENTEQAVAAVDKTIAKGVRGTKGERGGLGVTAAQIEVLSALSVAKLALDDLIKLAKVGGSLQATYNSLN